MILKVFFNWNNYMTLCSTFNFPGLVAAFIRSHAIISQFCFLFFPPFQIDFSKVYWCHFLNTYNDIHHPATIKVKFSTFIVETFTYTTLTVKMGVILIISTMNCKHHANHYWCKQKLESKTSQIPISQTWAMNTCSEPLN